MSNDKPAFNPNQPYQVADKPKFDPTQAYTPVTQPEDQTPGMGEAFFRGAGNGLTLGAEPVAAGGLEALKQAVMNGEISIDDIAKNYKSARDSEKQANDKAQDAHSLAYLGGNLVGGLPLAALTDGATALTGAEGFHKALQAGALIGAGAGAGNALSEGKDLSGVANDAIGGAGMGMAGGTLAHGAGWGLGQLADTEIAQNAGKAFKYGLQKVDLTKNGGAAVQQGVSNAAEALGLGLRDANKSSGATLGAVRQALQDSGATVNTTPTVEGIQKAITKLQSSKDPSAASDAAFLQKYLTNLTEGNKSPVQFNEVLPEETVPGTPSAQDKLEAKQASLQAKENAVPKGVQSEIVPSNDDAGNPFLNLVKKLPTEEEGYTNDKVAANLPDVPGTPDQVIPGGLGPDKTQNIRMGGIDPNATPFSEANDIKGSLTQFGGNTTAATPLKTNQAQNAMSGLGKGLNNELIHAPVGEGPATQLGAATQDARTSFGALKTLGLEDSDFQTNPMTGEMELTADAEQTLKNKVRQLGQGSDTAAGQNASDKLSSALEQLQSIDPEKAQVLQSQIERAGDINNLYRQGAGANFTRSSWYRTAPVQIANRVGNTDVARGAAAATDFAGNVVSSAVNGISSSSLVQGAKSMMQSGNPTAYKLASQLADAATKTGTAKNAALFSLMQQPGYRELMKQHGLGSDDSSTQNGGQ